MFITGIEKLILLAAGVDQRRGRTGRCGASRLHSTRILRGEDADRIVEWGRRRGSAEEELVGREAGALIRLEHVVGPPVLCGQLQIGIEDTVGVVDKPELRLRRAGANAT